MNEWSKNPVVEVKMLKGQAGGADWGNIDGDIENQTDLITLIDSKADAITPISDAEIDDIVG